MPETSELVLEILDDNKKEILKETVKFYSKQIDDVLEWGKDALETVSQVFSHPDVKNPLSEYKNKFVINTPEKQAGMPLSYAGSALPEGKNDGTLETVTRQDIKVDAKDSNLFKNVSFSLRDLAPSLVFKNKNTNESLRVYTGERFGVGYEKREGFNDKFRKGVKADYNVFSGRATVGTYYRTPNESVNLSVFHKKGNYGIIAGYSNEKGLNVRGAVDKNGAALNVRFDKEYKDCYTSVGAYASSEYKTVGVTGRVTF